MCAELRSACFTIRLLPGPRVMYTLGDNKGCDDNQDKAGPKRLLGERISTRRIMVKLVQCTSSMSQLTGLISDYITRDPSHLGVNGGVERKKMWWGSEKLNSYQHIGI